MMAQAMPHLFELILPKLRNPDMKSFYWLLLLSVWTYSAGLPSAGLSQEGTTSDASAPLEPLSYNHPGLTVDLGVGLWAWPLPIDFDGAGDLDLVVNCPDKPSNGVYFFENTSGVTSPKKMPVFEAGRRISKGLQNVQVSYVDDQPRVTTPGKVYPDFLNSGLTTPQTLGLKPGFHKGKTRADMWRLVDYDGDGRTDIIAGIGYWGDYGWDNAYNADGE